MGRRVVTADDWANNLKSAKRLHDGADLPARQSTSSLAPSEVYYGEQRRRFGVRRGPHHPAARKDAPWPQDRWGSLQEPEPPDLFQHISPSPAGWQWWSLRFRCLEVGAERSLTKRGPELGADHSPGSDRDVAQKLKRSVAL